jgi:hypothetical protein
MIINKLKLKKKQYIVPLFYLVFNSSQRIKDILNSEKIVTGIKKINKKNPVLLCQKTSIEPL